MKNKPIVYGIRCTVTNMVYIGSTFTPQERFYAHLRSGFSSNLGLQLAIKQYGLQKFTVLIFNIVSFPPNADYGLRAKILRQQEQALMDLFPNSQLYNSVKAFA